jgi:hypothetical protein
MHRGLEVGLHLQPGMANENFVAEAIGNLAVFRLRTERGEPLDWQVLRVEAPGGHHYRIVIRHPDRILDAGIGHDLKQILDDLSNETVDQLRERYDDAQRRGFRPVPLRHVRERADLWQDDFWNWLG